MPGKWACRECETLIQAPVPAHVIDKDIPYASLLAHVMVAKFAETVQLYRQEKILGRADLAIPRSTLAQWVGKPVYSLSRWLMPCEKPVDGVGVNQVQKIPPRCSVLR